VIGLHFLLSQLFCSASGMACISIEVFGYLRVLAVCMVIAICHLHLPLHNMLGFFRVTGVLGLRYPSMSTISINTAVWIETRSDEQYKNVYSLCYCEILHAFGDFLLVNFHVLRPL
jgi:hypothetical protein